MAGELQLQFNFLVQGLDQVGVTMDAVAAKVDEVNAQMAASTSAGIEAQAESLDMLSGNWELLAEKMEAYNKAWDAALKENAARDVAAAKEQEDANTRMFELKARNIAAYNRDYEAALAENIARDQTAADEQAAIDTRLYELKARNILAYNKAVNAAYLEQAARAREAAEAQAALGRSRELTGLSAGLKQLKGDYNALVSGAEGFRGSSLRAFTQASSVARTYSNYLNRNVAMVANTANATSRLAQLLGLQSAATDAATAAGTANAAAEMAVTAAIEAEVQARKGLITVEEAQAAQETARKALDVAKAEKEAALAIQQAATIRKIAVIGTGTAALATGAALLYAGEKAAKYAEQIGDASNATGFTTQNLSAISLAARTAGVDFETVTRSLTFFSRGLGETGNENDRFHRTLQALGITTKDVNVAFEQVVEKLGRVQGSAAATADTMNLFRRAASGGGEDVAKLLHAIEAMPGGLAAWRTEAQKLAIEIGDKDVVAAREFLTQQRAMGAEFQSMVVHIGGEVIPYLTNLFVTLENGSKLISAGLQAIKLGFMDIAFPINYAIAQFQALGIIATGQFEAISAAMHGHFVEATTILKSTTESAKEQTHAATEALEAQAFKTQAAWDSFTNGLSGSFQRIQDMATGMKGTLEAPFISPVVKEYADKLGEIGQKLQDEIGSTEQLTNKREAASNAYLGNLRAIAAAEDALRRQHRLTAAEEQKANDDRVLALNLYNAKLLEITNAEIDAENKRLDAERKAAEEAAKAEAARVQRLQNGLDKYNDVSEKMVAKANLSAQARIVAEENVQLHEALQQELSLMLLARTNKEKLAIIREYQQRVIAIENSTQSAIQKVNDETSKKIETTVQHMSDQMERSLARLNTPMAQQILHLRDTLNTTRAVYDETLRKLAAEEKDAKAMTDQSLQAERLVQIDNARVEALQMLRQAEADAAEAAVAGMVGAIAGRRAQAGVEVIWDTAMAIRMFAKAAADSSTPGMEWAVPGDLLAGAQYTAAAVEWGLIAGSGGSTKAASAHSGGGGGATLATKTSATAESQRTSASQTTTSVITLDMTGRMMFTASEVATMAQALNAAVNDKGIVLKVKTVSAPPIPRS